MCIDTCIMIMDLLNHMYICMIFWTKAVFTPQLWDRNGTGTQPGPRVHTCSTPSSRSGTSRPPRDVIAVERFRNGSGTGPVGSVV